MIGWTQAMNSELNAERDQVGRRSAPDFVDTPMTEFVRDARSAGSEMIRPGEDIPVAARVFAVADTLDALTTDRPYRAASSWARRGDRDPRRGGHAVRPGRSSRPTRPCPTTRSPASGRALG